MLMLLACARPSQMSCGPGTHAEAGVCLPDSVAESDTDTDSDTDSDTDADTDSDTDTETGESPAVIQVYLLAGQSNMDGYGMYTGLPPSQRVGQSDVPLYWSGWGAFAPLAPASYGGVAYTGPEVSFGRALADAGQRVALVKHAVGGTDLATYWKPGADAADPDVGDGWAVFVQSLDAATAELDATGEPWEWAGLVWMQGESDALDASWAGAYQENLTHFLARVREETGVADLPAAVGLIACEGLCTYLDEVRAAQEAVADADPNAHLVETIDLPRNPNDPWHYDGPSMRTLGERFAAALLGEEAPAAPTAALAISSASTDYDGEFTVGWRFTTDRALTITDVGGFGTNYLWLSQEWGLWETNTHALVTRGTIPGWYEAPTSWRDGFWYTAVEPFELPPGDYVIGLVSWSGDGNVYANDAYGTVGEGVSYVEARYATGYWLAFPGTAYSGVGMSFLGPSFLYRE